MFNLLFRYRDNINSNNMPLHSNESGVFLVASNAVDRVHHRIFKGDTINNLGTYSYPNDLDRSVMTVTDEGVFYIDRLEESNDLRIKKENVDTLVRSYDKFTDVVDVKYNLGRLFVLLEKANGDTILDMINYTGNDFFLESMNYFDGRSFMEYKFEFDFIDAYIDNYNEVIYYRGSNEDGMFVFYTLDLINYSTKRVTLSNPENYTFEDRPMFDENTMYFMLRKSNEDLKIAKVNTTTVRNAVPSQLDITEMVRYIDVSDFVNVNLRLVSICREGFIVHYDTLEGGLIARADTETFEFFETFPLSMVLEETGATNPKFIHVPVTRSILGVSEGGHNQNRFAVTYIRNGISTVALLEWTKEVPKVQLKNIKGSSTQTLLSSDYMALVNKINITTMESFNNFQILTENRNTIAVTDTHVFIAMKHNNDNTTSIVKFAYDVNGGLVFDKSATYALEGTVDNIQVSLETIYLTSYHGNESVGRLVCTIIDADSLEESLVERTYINLYSPIKLGDGYSVIYNGEIFTANYNLAMNDFSIQKNRIGMDSVHRTRIPLDFDDLSQVINKKGLLSLGVDHQFLFVSICNDDPLNDGLYKYDVANLRSLSQLRYADYGKLYLIGLKEGFSNSLYAIRDDKTFLSITRDTLSIFNESVPRNFKEGDLFYLDGNYIYLLSEKKFLERIRMHDLHTDYVHNLMKDASILKMKKDKLLFLELINLNNYKIAPRFETKDTFTPRGTAPIKFPPVENNLAGIGRITAAPYKILYGGYERFDFNFLQNRYMKVPESQVYAAKSFCEHITTNLVPVMGVKHNKISPNGRYQFVITQTNDIKFFSHSIIGNDLVTNEREIHPRLVQYTSNIKDIKFTSDSRRMIVSINVRPWILVFEVTALTMHADYNAFSTHAEIKDFAINHDDTIALVFAEIPYMLAYEISPIGLTPVRVQDMVDIRESNKVTVSFGKGFESDDKLILEVLDDTNSNTYSFRVIDYLGRKYIVRRNPYPFSNLHAVREFNHKGTLLVTSDNRRIFCIDDIQKEYGVDHEWATNKVPINYEEAEFFKTVNYRHHALSINKDLRILDLSDYGPLEYNADEDGLFVYFNGIYASPIVNYSMEGTVITLEDSFMEIFEGDDLIAVDIVAVDTEMTNEVVVIESLTSVVAVPFENINFDDYSLRVYVGGIYQIQDLDYIYDPATNTITTNTLNVRWEGDYVFDFILVSKQNGYRRTLESDATILVFPMSEFVNKDRLELFVGGIFYSKDNYMVNYTATEIRITDKGSNFKEGYHVELIINESSFRTVEPITMASDLEQTRLAVVTNNPLGIYFLKYDNVLNVYRVFHSIKEEHGIPVGCSYSNDGKLFAIAYSEGPKRFRLFQETVSGDILEVNTPDALYAADATTRIKLSGSGSHLIQTSVDGNYLNVFKINKIPDTYEVLPVELPEITDPVLDFDMTNDGKTIITVNGITNRYLIGDGTFYEFRSQMINPGNMNMERVIISSDERFIFIGSSEVAAIHNDVSTLYSYMKEGISYNLNPVQFMLDQPIDLISLSRSENIVSIYMENVNKIFRIDCNKDELEQMDFIYTTTQGDVIAFISGYKNFILSNELNKEFLRYKEVEMIFDVEDEYRYVDTIHISVNDITHRNGTTILTMFQNLLAIVGKDYLTVDYPYSKFPSIKGFQVVDEYMYILTDNPEKYVEVIKIGLIVDNDIPKMYQMKKFDDIMLKSMVRHKDKQDVTLELYRYGGMFKESQVNELVNPTYMIGRQVMSMDSDYSTDDIYTSIITRNHKEIDGVKSYDYTLHVVKSIKRNNQWDKKNHVSMRIRSNSSMPTKQIKTGIFTHGGNIYVIVYANLPNDVKDFPIDGKVFPGETLVAKLTPSLLLDTVRRSDDGVIFCGYTFENGALMIEERNVWEVL